MKNENNPVHEKDNLLLMVIDIQEKLFPAMEPAAQKRVLDAVTLAAECARLFSIPTLVTEQYPRGLGATIDPVIRLFPEKTVLEKTTFNCLKEDTIFNYVRNSGKKNIIVTGMETHICVYQTVISLLDEGFTVIPLMDGMASRNQSHWQWALDRFTALGASPMPAETLAFLLLERSGTQEFKEISRVLKSF